MNYNDIFITNMLFTNINKINTGIVIIDFFIIIFILFIFSNKELITNNYFYNKISLIFNKVNKITFTADKKNQSKNFRAIMFNLSINKNVDALIEITKWKWSDETEDYSFFQVEQTNSFEIEKDIYGKIYKKEKTIYGNYKTEVIEVIYFELYSKRKSLQELQKWVEIRLHEFDNYLLNKNNNKQFYIEIFNSNLNNRNPNNPSNSSNPNHNNNDLEFNKYEWVSAVSFENRFFRNKNKIIENIKFFLENELWYKERGIPYTLGFLLYGNPGCGKTGFIKALMNLTNFNAIAIKLNSNFNFLKLKDIIYKKELNNDIIIPLHKRIFIFEDIDCMTDIIIDRDRDKEKKNKNNNNNNNLSYLLNILDGIHETSGRIIIMTTNKPEVLDKALIRPGRIDHIIHFENATTDDIKNMINFYWNNKKEIKINEDLNLKYTHAEVINICRKSSDINETISFLHSF